MILQSRCVLHGCIRLMPIVHFGGACRGLYLCLYRFSMSARPCHLSGSGMSDFVRIWTCAAVTLSSPLSVLFIPPLAPMMSPASTRLFKLLCDSKSPQSPRAL